MTNTKINISTHNLGGIESGVARTLKKNTKKNPNENIWYLWWLGIFDFVFVLREIRNTRDFFSAQVERGIYR